MKSKTGYQIGSRQLRSKQCRYRYPRRTNHQMHHRHNLLVLHWLRMGSYQLNHQLRLSLYLHQVESCSPRLGRCRRNREDH